jgi:F420-non-reducing hydrogenase iron-sulfur subunit
MITGCHPGECHYLEQNYKALRRIKLLKRTLAPFGINPDRVKLVWASAAEGVKLAKEIGVFVDEIKELGPLNWPNRSTPEVFAGAPATEVEEVAG